jgi:hypothetical protein
MHTPEKITRAVRYVVFAKKPVTVENVNRYLQMGDNITQEILDAHIEAAKRITGTPTRTNGNKPEPMAADPQPATTGTPTPTEGTIREPVAGQMEVITPERVEEFEAVEHPLPVPGNEVEQVEPTPEPTPEPKPEPRRGVKAVEPEHLSIADAQCQLVQSQMALRNALQSVREHRGALAASLARWQSSIGAIVTPEQNARAFIESETALRQARKDGTAPARRSHRVYRSAIDRVAAATNYGPGAGGGLAFRRVVKLDNGQWVKPRDVHSVGR